MTSTKIQAYTHGVSCPNFCTDYVICYNFIDTENTQAETQFVKLIKSLRAVGLATEVRYGDSHYILIFVKVASHRNLEEQIYRSRLQEWLHDTRDVAPPEKMQRNLEELPISKAERLLFVYTLLTCPDIEGGVGITPKIGEWKCVDSLFPLHDPTFNKDWVKKLSSKYFLDAEDFIEIKNHFGERIAFYFAFLQSYFFFLTLPAGFGFCAWILLGQYSPIYAIFNGLWCVIFVEYWKIQQEVLSAQWGTNAIRKSRHQRSEFRYESTLSDPVTGESIQIYSPLKRLSKQLLQIPFAIAATVALGGLIAACFAIEIFISEIYDGPFKKYLVLLPTVILTIVMPAISALLTGFASKLTILENYKTQDAHEASMIQKVFVLNFITSYLPIFLTAFVYVPFGQVLVPYLNFFHMIVKYFAKLDDQVILPNSKFRINKDRLTSQVIYFTVTAQITDFGLEVIVPYVKRKIFSKLKEVQANRAAKRMDRETSIIDDADESAFLARVRNEAYMNKYDVTPDFREMVVQFGYLSLFSVIWPLTAISFLINNWVEIRGDAIKIAMETQRPVPWRADSIGPWIDALGFLVWLGSLTSAAIVYLFSGGGLGPDGTPRDIKGWGLLLAIFLSEHLYMATQIGVRKVLGKLQSTRRRGESSERLKTRKRFVQDILDEGFVGEKPYHVSSQETDRIKISEDGVTAKHEFWQNQHDLIGIIDTGRGYIYKASSSESKKEL